MGTVPKLHEYLLELDYMSAKNSRDYIGKRVINPAMFLEDNVPTWSRTSTLAEVSAAVAIWKERVCVSDFPARYSPPFWLAYAALQTIYKVLNSVLLAHFSEEVLQEVSDLLFDLWVHLISAGPGSSHLEMMDVILKNQHFPLWKYMESLKGDSLKLLLTTLKCDFVYQEDVSSDHFATLMETHIDKIFKHILRPEQFQEAQRGFLELHLHYLSRMNHVPPHIGPRLSHLCFLICQKYELENPYLGLDDWVLMRHHLKIIKDVVTDRTFTVASEAQYRAPITLEKIFQAAILNNMLELMFKDFMSLLLTICGHNHSKKCKRLFLAYKTALFQEININGMEVQPDWLFDQCITTLTQVASTNGIETHIEQMIVVAEHDCLLTMTDLAGHKNEKWHKLLENYVVSGRNLLVQEATHLLVSCSLKDSVFSWKENLPRARLLIDIISDLPKTFLQDDAESSILNTVGLYTTFLKTLITQLRDADLILKVQGSLHKCVIKCLAKDPVCKAGLAAHCIQEQVISFQDMNFLREILFCVDKLLKDDDCLTVNETLTSAVESLLAGCLDTFREKGYISVDYNTLMISISLTCISGDQYIQTDKTGPPYDIYFVLYNNVVLQFIRMHQTHGTLRLVTSMVPQVIQLIHEGIEQGTSIARCVSFLHWLGTNCPEVITDHMTDVIELFLDWECYSDIYPLMAVLYPSDPLSIVGKVPVMFEKLKTAVQTDRQTLLTVLHLVAENHAEVFSSEHICQLVNMYRQETTTSQQLILQIIHRVALHSPAVVFGLYSHFTDDNKFPVTSLKDRAPILAALTQHNEEIAKKTTDYLMTHVSNKDSAISLVAMETLEPLLRRSPACLVKHKQKLKTVGKMSSSLRVKEICKELIPDSRVKGPKTVQKDQKDNKPPMKKAEVHKDSLSKTATKQNKVSKTVKSKKIVTGKQSSFESVVQPDVSLMKLAKDTDAKSDEWMDNALTSGRLEEVHDKNVTPDQSGIGSVKKEETVSQIISDTNKMVLATSEDKKTQDSNITTVNKEASKKKHEASAFFESEMKESAENTETGGHMPIFHEETLEQPGKMVTKQHHDTVKLTDMKIDSDQSLNIEPSNNKEQGVWKTADENESIKQTDIMLTNDLSDTMINSPPIYLSSPHSSQAQVSMLRRHLKMAGYECWVDTGQTGSGDGAVHAGIQEAKVVICCLTKMYLSSSHCSKELSAALTLSKPVIPLALEPISVSPTSLLKDLLAIRFYTKPGEVKVTMGFWVEHKFQELLMRLNYLRILPHERIITKAYENWWLPKQLAEEKGGCGDDTVDSISTRGFPNVFISYNWGKQQLVKILYHHLTSLGYSCWLGVYQMSGSESLYNKITQGLQGCRVMLACITKKYTRADNCQQEIRLAHSLKRPIIPLLLEEVRWPPEDDIGKLLVGYECIKLENMNGKKSFEDVQFEKLADKLNLYVPNDKQKELKSDVNSDTAVKEKGEQQSKDVLENETISPDSDGRNIQTATSDSVTLIDKWAKTVKPSGEAPKRIKSSKQTMQKSSSMFEIEKSSGVMVTNGSNKIVTSKTDDDLIVKKSIPEGVIVDEMGYTVKSSRSKSCVIL